MARLVQRSTKIPCTSENRLQTVKWGLILERTPNFAPARVTVRPRSGWHMPLTLNCPKCSKAFRVRDEAIGQRVRCPTCQAIVQVPGAIAPASMADLPVLRHLPETPPARPFAPVTHTNLPQLRPGTPMTAQEREESIFGSSPQVRHDASAPPSLIVRDAAGRAPGALMGDAPMPADPAPPRKTPRPKRERPRADSTVPADWRAAYGGISMARFGLVLVILGMLAWEGAQIWHAIDPKATTPVVTWAQFSEDSIKAGLASAGAVFALLGLALTALGRFRWLLAPAHSRSQFLALGSLVMLIVGVGGIGYGVSQLLATPEGREVVTGTEIMRVGIWNHSQLLMAATALLILGEFWAVLWGGQIGSQTTATSAQFFVGLLPVAVGGAIYGANYLRVNVLTDASPLHQSLWVLAPIMLPVLTALVMQWMILGLAKKGIRGIGA